MWKKIRYVTYALLLILIFSVTCKFREYYYVPLIQYQLDRYTDSSLKFRNFSLEFPLNIIVYNVEYKDRIFIDTATLRFEPLILLHNLKNPLKSLVAVNIDEITVLRNVASDTDTQTVQKKETKTNKSELINKYKKKLSFKAFVNKITVIYPKAILKATDTEMDLDDKLTVSTNLSCKDTDMTVNGTLELQDNKIFSDFQMVSEGTVQTDLDFSGQFNINDNTFSCSVITNSLTASQLKVGKNRINIKRTKDKISMVCKGELGNIYFQSDNEMFSVWKSSGNVVLADVNDLASAKIKYDVVKNDNLLKISAQADDISFLKNNFGIVEVNFENNNSQVNLDCKHNLNNRFDFMLNPEGQYLVNVYNKENKIAKAKGNYNTGEVSVNMRDIPLHKVIFLSSLNKDVKGTLSLYGNINSSSGTVKFFAKKLSSKQLKKFDVNGELKKENSQWFCNIATQDKKLELKSFYESKQNHNFEFLFADVDSNNIFKILGWKKPKVSGSATGYIKHDALDASTKADIKLKNGTLYDNKFKTWDICSYISEKTVDISTFSFVGENSSINLNALLDFNKNSNQSYLNFDMKNFKVKDAILNSQIDFTGNISSNTNEISGILNAKELNINGFDFKHTSEILLTPKRLKIQNIKDDNNLSGDVTYTFKNKKILAHIKAVQSKLSDYYSKVKGKLNFDFSIDGVVTNPKINANLSVSNGIYNDMTFDITSKVVTKKNVGVYLQKFRILFDKNNSSVLQAYGKLGINNNDITLKLKNFSHRNINRFVGFITPFKGTFYGDGKITGNISDLSCLLNIYSDELFIKSIKFNNLNSKIELQRDNISIKDSKIKLNDSEIKIMSGKFNIKNGAYSTVLKLINTHVGPFDIFGTIDLNGKMIKKMNGSIYTGNVSLKDFWLNRQKIQDLPLNYVINNKKINFETDKKDKLKVQGCIKFNRYPNIVLDKISISKNNKQFNINGSVSTTNLDITAETKSVDADILTDIFNLPFDMQGPIDINLVAKDKISNPSIDFNAKSKDGNIFGVSYDTLDINTVARNNILDIKNFKINKKGEYSSTITGTCPFWLDPALKKKMSDKEVNINYEFIDDKAAILKEYTQEQIVAKSGKIDLRGSLTGTLNKMISTGELVANISNIATNSYVNKIKNLALNFSWENNLLEIKKCTAKIGSGIVEVIGNIKLSGLSPSSYDISVFTPKKGIPIVIRELPIPTSGIFNMEKTQTLANFSKAVPTFDFKLNGNADTLKLTGWVKLENAKFCFPSPVKVTETSDFTIQDIFPNVYIDIDLLSAASTNYENENIDVYIDGKVNLKGPIDDIVANGILESSEGRLSYIGNEFNIVNSKVEIINNDIFITGEGESEVYSAGDSYAETIKVFVDRSSIDNLKVRFASKNDPTMDSKTALSRLTKTDPSKSTNLDTSTDYLVKQQAIRLLGSNVAMPLANTVLKKTGLVDNVRLGYVNQDNLEIKDNEQPTVAELLYGMKYSVEKNINRLLQVGYSVTFDQVERELDLKHALEMSFKVSRDLFLKGSYGLNSDNPDYEPEKKVMLEQRLRFGGKKKK